MSEVIGVGNGKRLYGREKIYLTVDSVTPKNIVDVLNKALTIHRKNASDENYLYWYRRGKQPIYDKTKVTREEINNMMVENHASEIVAFKNGYFLAQPAFYKTRKGREEATAKVSRLNDYLYLSGKQDADNELVDWMHTVGVGTLFVEPDPETIVSVNAIDPRYSFVAYRNNTKKTPLCGVHISIVGNNLVFEVYTESQKITVDVGKWDDFNGIPSAIEKSSAKITVQPNVIGMIPIIEYYCNNALASAFEAAVPLLDAINLSMSDRLDAVDQFVNSLLVFYNCELGDDEEGNPITPRYVRAAGALFLKSIGENKADLKEISSQLNQADQQVLVDYMYEQALRIVGMPTTTKGGASTSDTGTAVLLRDGWEHADACARNTEDLFKKSNRQFDRIFLKILRDTERFEIDLNDFELQFPRTETMNLLTKTQGALNLKQLGLSPELTLAKSGISNDPVGDVEASKDYIDAVWGNDGREISAEI